MPKTLIKHISKVHVIDLGWLISTQITLLFLGLLSIKITSSMGPAEFGKLALAISVMNFLILFVYNPLEQTFGRFFFEYYFSNNKSAYLQFLFRTVALLGAIVVLCIICLGGIFLMTKFQVDKILFMVLAGVYALLMASILPFHSLINLMRQRKIFSLMQIYDKLSQVLGLIGLFFLGMLLSTKVLAVYVFFASIGLLIRLHYFNKLSSFSSFKQRVNKPQDPIENNMKKEMLVFVPPIFILGLMNWLQTNSERWIIQASMTTADVGVYFLMSTIANTIISMFATVGTQFVNPYIYEKFSDLTNHEKVLQGFRYFNIFVISIAVITIIACIITYFGRDILIRFISNPQFVASSYLLPLVIIGIGLYNIGQTYCSIGFLLKQNQKYYIPKIIVSTLTVIVYMYAGKYHGLSGIAISSITMGCIFVALIYVVNIFIKRSILL